MYYARFYEFWEKLWVFKSVLNYFYRIANYLNFYKTKSLKDCLVNLKNLINLDLAKLLSKTSWLDPMIS